MTYFNKRNLSISLIKAILFISLFSFQSIQAAAINICSQSASGYSINGSGGLDVRSKLSNPTYFGTTGSYCDHTFSYTTLPTSTITEAVLIAQNCDIYWSGYESDGSFTTAELTEIDNWIANTNGQIIAGCDGTSNDPICESLGLVLNTVNVASGTSTPAPVVSACFPNTVSPLNNGGGAVTNFLTVPPGLQIITYQDNISPVNPSAVYGNSIFATSDVNMFTGSGCCLSDGPLITNSNDQFLGDAMCAVAEASQGNPTCLSGMGVGGSEAVPTLSEWGTIFLMILLGLLGTIFVAKRKSF